MELLQVTNVSLLEQGAEVLQPVSFGLPAGRKLALAGESGAGKSTLLQIIGGLIQPSGGEVRVRGSRVRGPAETLVPGHPGVAYLSQKSDLPRFFRVEQVLQYASKRPAAEAQAVYEVCRIGHLAARRTNQLSGGEQQRVALARLLLGAPELLLLDEPYSNLDRSHKRVMQNIIAEVGERLSITCLLVSHDATDTLSWADEILVLQNGRLVQQGAPEQLYRHPADEYVAGLFGDYSLLTEAEAHALGWPANWPAVFPGYLVRPEQLRLGAGSGPAIAGTVRSIRFLGSHYLADIQLITSTVQVRVETGELEAGKKVQVSVSAGRL